MIIIIAGKTLKGNVTIEVPTEEQQSSVALSTAP